MMPIRQCHCNLALFVKDMKTQYFLLRRLMRTLSQRVFNSKDIIEYERNNQPFDFILTATLSDEMFYNLEWMTDNLTRMKKMVNDIEMSSEIHFSRVNSCNFCHTELHDLTMYTKVHLTDCFNKAKQYLRDVIDTYVRSFGLTCRSKHCLHCLLVNFSKDFFDEVNALSP